MTISRKKEDGRKASRASRRIVLAFLAALVLFRPVPAHAQVCEIPGSAMIAAAGVVAFLEAYIPATILQIINHMNTELSDTTDLFEDSVSTMRDDILAHMRNIWDEWDLALHDMTAQMAGSATEHGRQFSSMFDSSGMTENARVIQEEELETRKANHPNDQACQFDTQAHTMTKTDQVASAVTRGFVADSNKMAYAPVGTPAATSNAAYVDARVTLHATKFCDPASNGGAAGCVGVPPVAMRGADIMPSKTIFGELTLEMENPDVRDALTELVTNITGYKPMSSIPNDVLNTPAGQQARVEQRRYLAQMDAITGLIYSVIADRAPSGDPSAPGVPGGIQELRLRQGISAPTVSTAPSSREVRQAVLEQIRDPKYYTDLIDAPSTVAQKDLYLRAYNLMLLYKVIEKTERIALAYAIQTANLVARSGPRGGNAIEGAGTR